VTSHAVRNILCHSTNFSCVYKQEELARFPPFRETVLRAFLLRHHRAALPPSLVRQPVSFRPVLPYDVFLGISTIFRPSRRSILVSLGFPLSSATDQGHHLVWCVLSKRTTHRRRKLRYLRVIDVINASYTTSLSSVGCSTLFVSINWKQFKSAIFQPSNSLLLSSWLIVSFANNVIHLIILVFVEKLRKSLHSLRNEIFFLEGNSEFKISKTEAEIKRVE